MDAQEIAELATGIAALLCVGAGIPLLFKTLRREGSIDLISVRKGKLHAGSAGVLLLVCGTVISVSLLIYRHDTLRQTITLPNGTVVTQKIGRDFKVPSPKDVDVLMKYMEKSGFLDEAKKSMATPAPTPATPSVK